eukprot:XP_011662712.1 PREDICTED: uncharacterized protein LOC105437615 [Strongylocentrotus purpuratus]
MAEMIPDSALVRLDRTFRDVERLITSDSNYALAREQLRAINVNLERISNILSLEMYNSLKGCAQRLLNLCNDGQAAEARDATTRNDQQAVDLEEPEGGTRQPEVGDPHTSTRPSQSSRFTAPRTNSGKRGRPKVELTREQLITFQKSGYTVKRMATHFNCSSSLVYKRLHANGLKVRDKYLTMSDEELKTIIADLHEKFPNTGSEMMSGLLHAHGHTVQRTRVRKLLAEVDPPSAAERWGNGVSRRVYKVASPNSLWHMDGHMKLIRLWRDVYKDVIAYYYNKFYALEDEGLLDPSDDVHRFSLHAVYLEPINERLSIFQHAWNHHRVRTEKHRTPEQIWRDGMLESSLDNTAVSRVFETETLWEDVVEAMLRRYHLSDLPDDNEPPDDDTSNISSRLSNISSRLSQMQKEELDLILAGNGGLRDKFRAYSEKVAEYLQL